MRFAPLLLMCATFAVACGSEQATAPSGLASLVVRVDDDGDRGPDAARQLKLDCRAPDDGRACRAAAGITGADLAPAAGDRACTQLYGGPQTASISGMLRGERVNARFSRADGCEIARWEHVQPLLSEVR